MKKLLVVLFSLLLASSAFAADSAGNRKDKSLYVGFVPFGLHIATLISQPMQVGFYATPDLLVGVESGGATSEQDDGDSKSTATYTNQGVFARYFTGNSFNFLLAYNKRAFTADATVTQTDYVQGVPVTSKAEAAVEAEANVVTLGVANHWTFDFGMVLGFDWLVASGIASESNSYSIKSNTGISSTEVEKDLDDLGKALNVISAFPGVMILTLGFTF